MNTASVISIVAPKASPCAKSAHPAALDSVRVRFDAFELDEPNALLLRNGKAVALAPKPFSVLCALARRPGSLLTKHALLDDVWGHQFVSESVLATAVSEVRTVLDDHPRQPRFIETVSRRGYRFIAPTSAISDVASVRPIDFSGSPSFESRSETPPLPLAARDIALSRKRSVVCAGSSVEVPRRELDWTSPQPVFATADEVRYAQELKRQLRARLLREVVSREVA